MIISEEKGKKKTRKQAKPSLKLKKNKVKTNVDLYLLCDSSSSKQKINDIETASCELGMHSFTIYFYSPAKERYFSSHHLFQHCCVSCAWLEMQLHLI